MSFSETMCLPDRQSSKHAPCGLTKKLVILSPSMRIYICKTKTTTEGSR